MVRLPFKSDPDTLGESLEMSIRRFLSIERKLAKNKELGEAYAFFINDYLKKGHMVAISRNEIVKPYSFLPHHNVMRPESTTTKLRVVFDASAKTFNNILLNEILSTGPSIQDSLFAILVRFRKHRYVMCADI